VLLVQSYLRAPLRSHLCLQSIESFATSERSGESLSRSKVGRVYLDHAQSEQYTCHIVPLHMHIAFHAKLILDFAQTSSFYVNLTNLGWRVFFRKVKRESSSWTTSIQPQDILCLMVAGWSFCFMFRLTFRH
jgi:hypothetical protein